jgi:hypothetical protein
LWILGGSAGNAFVAAVCLVHLQADRLFAMDDFQEVLPLLTKWEWLNSTTLDAQDKTPTLGQHMRAILERYQVRAEGCCVSCILYFRSKFFT